MKTPIEESIQSPCTRPLAKHHCSENRNLPVTKKPETRGIQAKTQLEIITMLYTTALPFAFYQLPESSDGKAVCSVNRTFMGERPVQT